MLGFKPNLSLELVYPERSDTRPRLEWPVRPVLILEVTVHLLLEFDLLLQTFHAAEAGARTEHLQRGTFKSLGSILILGQSDSEGMSNTH